MLWTLAIAAAAPLVHDPGDDSAVARARDAGLVQPVEPLALDAVRRTAPWSRNGQPLGPCSPGTVDPAALRGHVLYGEFDAAHERLAIERMRCEGTATQRAQLEQAAGLLALLDGDEASGERAFAVAKGFDPTLPFDPSFPAQHAALYERTEPAVARLITAPEARQIDSAPPGSSPVAAGDHGLVFDTTGLHLRHSDVDDVVAVPGAYPLELPSLESDSARRDLTHVLSAALGQGERVHVAGPDALWTGTTGRTDWSSVPWPAPAPEPAEVPTVRRRPTPWLVAGAGAVVAVGGGLLAGLSSAQAQDAASEMRAASATGDRDSFERLEQDGLAANRRVRVGHGVAISGAGITSLGLVWGVLR